MGSKQQSIKEEYLQFCSDNGIQPSDAVIEVIDRKSSVLNISSSSRSTSKHETTDLVQQAIIDREVLSASFALTCQLPQLLQLRIQAIQQYLSSQNITALSWGLSQSTTLLTLSITQCALEDNAVLLLAKSLSEKNYNISLQELILAANNLTEIGVQSICECLKDHSSIKRLDFSRNQVKSDCVGAFLQKNKTIQQLDISFNPYDFESVESLLQGATRNESLCELRMSGLVVGSISRILAMELIESKRSLLQIFAIDIDLNDIEHPKEWRRLEDSLRVNCNLKELLSSKLLFTEDNPKTNGIALCLQANTLLPNIKDEKSLKEYKIRVPNGKLKDIITEKLEILLDRITHENMINLSQQLDLQEDLSQKQQCLMQQRYSKTGQISVGSSTVNASEFFQGQQNTLFEDTLQGNNIAFKEEEEDGNLNIKSLNTHSINNNSVSSCHQIHFTEELVSESKRYRDKLKWRNDQQHKQHNNSSMNFSNECDRNYTQIPSIQQTTDKTQQATTVLSYVNLNTDENQVVNHHPILSSQEQNHSTLVEDFRNYPTFQTMASNEPYQHNDNKNIIKNDNTSNAQFSQRKKLQQTYENQQQESSQSFLIMKQEIQRQIDSRLEEGFSQIFTILDSQQTSIDLLNLQVRQLQAKIIKQQQTNDIGKDELILDYEEEEQVFEKIRQFQQRMDKVKRALQFKQTSQFSHTKYQKEIENSASIDVGKTILSSQSTTICPSVLRELPLKASNRYSSIERNKNMNLSNSKNANILEVNKSSIKKENTLRSSLKLLRQSNTKQSNQKENISYSEVGLTLVNSSNSKNNNMSRIIPKMQNCSSAILVEQECNLSNSTSNSCSPDKQSILKIKDLNLSSMASSSTRSFSSMKVMQNTTTQSGLSRQSEQQQSTGLGKPFERVQMLILEGLNGSMNNPSDNLEIQSLNSTQENRTSKVFQIDLNGQKSHLLKIQSNESIQKSDKNNCTQDYNNCHSYNNQKYLTNTRNTNKENVAAFDQCQTGPYRKSLESTGMKRECQNNPSEELIEELRRRGINYDILS